MKKLITVFALILITYTSWAQEDKSSQYTFPNFEIGTVKFKVGADVQAKLNYNTLREEMLFMNGDTVLVLAEPAKIDAVVIKNRKFVPNGEFFYEEIPVKSNFLYIRHIATLLPPPVDTGLGKTNNTGQSNVSSVNWFVGTYNFVLPEYNLKRKDEFYLKKGSKFVYIKGINSLEQFFPGQLNEIKAFMSENRIDLSKTDDMVKVIDKFSK